ncbi:MAG: hypothetical protein ACK5KQ_05525 [Anaerorhabdus sp.]
MVKFIKKNENRVKKIYKNRYGFLKEQDLKHEGFSEKVIDFCSDISWYKTSDYELDNVKNHCGAILVCNLCKYLLKETKDIFKDVHFSVGNGPILHLNRLAKRYFKKGNYQLQVNKVDSIDDYILAINENRPVSFLLSSGINDFHWVMGIGYRKYENGDFYIKIVDGWHSDSLSYFMANKGSLWISSFKYHIKK